MASCFLCQCHIEIFSCVRLPGLKKKHKALFAKVFALKFTHTADQSILKSLRGRNSLAQNRLMLPILCIGDYFNRFTWEWLDVDWRKVFGQEQQYEPWKERWLTGNYTELYCKLHYLIWFSRGCLLHNSCGEMISDRIGDDWGLTVCIFCEKQWMKYKCECIHKNVLFGFLLHAPRSSFFCWQLLKAAGFRSRWHWRQELKETARRAKQLSCGLVVIV